MTGARVKGSEMITEIYVDRTRLAAFMEDARDVLRAHRANVIYGTVRLIEKDDETFLAWARDRYACIIFNLHVDHTPAEIDRAAERLPRADRSRHPPRRELLPDLPSVGAAGSGRAMLPAVAAVPGAQASVTIPERCSRATGIATTESFMFAAWSMTR